MKKIYRPWVQVSLKSPNDPPDKTKITYIRPAPRPYSVVSVLAKDISAANSMPAGDSNTVMPQTSSTTTGIATPSGSVSPPADNLAPGNNSVTGSSATGGTAGQGGANQGPETYNDALKNEQQRGIYTSPSGSSEFFPGGSTPPNLELPIGVEIPPIDEMPTLIITPPEGETFGVGRCLGGYSIGYIGQIEYFLLQELNLRQSLLALAAVMPDWSATLTSIAEENISSAEQLASAYYSIANTVYWPATVPGISSNAVPEVELNRLYAATRWLEGEYRVSAARISDPCLAALYGALAAIKATQARSLLLLTGISEEEIGEEPI